jgi:hypothetical protein
LEQCDASPGVSRLLHRAGHGEPVAIGITVVIILGVAFAAACWLIDQKKKREAEEKKNRRKPNR